jgi:hypothetical protein
MRFRRFLALGNICLFTAMAAAQAPTTKPEISPINNDFVQKQFGTSCTMIDAQQAYAADLNGDGIEDMVIPARCTNPMIDQIEHNFSVIDPYYEFFGYGDPKITTTFVTEDPGSKGLVVLVIHGSGAESWHSPAAKFIIINLAYKQINVRKMMVKKRKVTAIYTQENTGDQMVAAIFWNGKKYKYQPMGSTLE